MTGEVCTQQMGMKEVINALKGLVFGSFGRTTPKEREALDKAIKALEAQRWIPVSERLPEINKPVLVWLYDEYYLSELHSIGGVLYWDFDLFDLSGDEFDDVIAWMPLPEAYKEGK